MRYYYLLIDRDNNIVGMMDTFYEQDGIPLTYEEYNKAKLYYKFNPENREFYESKESQKQEEVNRLEQIEQAVGALAEQVAKNTLIGGNE